MIAAFDADESKLGISRIDLIDLSGSRPGARLTAGVFRCCLAEAGASRSTTARAHDAASFAAPAGGDVGLRRAGGEEEAQREQLAPKRLLRTDRRLGGAQHAMAAI
jgi:hypothetical protein